MKKSNRKLVHMLAIGLTLPIAGTIQMKAEPSVAIVQQNQNISGTVTDGSESIIGASVVVKGRGMGTVTDANGHFSLDVKPGTLLEISYVGYKSITVKASNNMKIILAEDKKMIDEVVVTALGIKRDRKALGYGVGEVKGEELTKAKETNVINSLAGKIPGLVVSQTAGGASGSTRVILRGSTEMTGNNQPYMLLMAFHWIIPIMAVLVLLEDLTLVMEYQASTLMILRQCLY